MGKWRPSALQRLTDFNVNDVYTGLRARMILTRVPLPFTNTDIAQTHDGKATPITRRARGNRAAATTAPKLVEQRARAPTFCTNYVRT